MSDGNPAVGFALLVILVVGYFAPFLVAGWRGHHQKAAIFFLNLLLGWTVVGWVVAFVWAWTNPATVTESKAAPLAPVAAPDTSAAEQIAKLVALRDQGALTEDEFVALKAKVVGAA